MIRTEVTPSTDMVSFAVPESYIGKVLEIIAFTKDEGIDLIAHQKSKAKFTILHTNVSDFKFNRDEANER